MRMKTSSRILLCRFTILNFFSSTWITHEIPVNYHNFFLFLFFLVIISRVRKFLYWQLNVKVPHIFFMTFFSLFIRSIFPIYAELNCIFCVSCKIFFFFRGEMIFLLFFSQLERYVWRIVCYMSLQQKKQIKMPSPGAWFILYLKEQKKKNY